MELDLTTYEGLVRGTSHGRVIAIGDADPYHVMMATLGEPVAAMRGKGTGGEGDPTRHKSIAGSVTEADIQMMATWIQEGAQPDGSLEERTFALVLLHIITLDNNQEGFYTWKHSYTTSLNALKMALIGGVQVSITRADAEGWEARVSHPNLRCACVVSGAANRPRPDLDLSTARQFCPKCPLGWSRFRGHECVLAFTSFPH